MSKEPRSGRGAAPPGARAVSRRRVGASDRTRENRAGRRGRYAAFAFVAYMSTYSCPDSRMTSVITESVTARST